MAAELNSQNTQFSTGKLRLKSIRFSSREISLIAVLGALSAVLRIPFSPIPGLQPSSFIISCSGYSFGFRVGGLVGILTAFLSSIFLGVGPWTPFQMLAWGALGLSFAALSRLNAPRVLFLPLLFIWGYLFGFIMNLWYLFAFGFPFTLSSILALQLASLWMDTLHAIGNVAFFLILGRQVLNIFQRFRERFLINTIK